MGLDMLDIVVSIEQAFDIDTRDADWQQMSTVGKVHDYVVQRLRESGKLSDGASLEEAGFRRVRQMLAGGLDLDPARISRETLLDDVLPRHGRRHLWRKLKIGSGLDLPPLVPPAEVKMAGMLPIFAFLGAFFLEQPWRLFGLVAAIGLVPVFRFVYWLWSNRVYHCRTVGDLSDAVVIWNCRQLMAESGAGIKEGEVWPVLVRIVAEVTEFPASDVEPESDLVKDLCVGRASRALKRRAASVMPK